MRSTPRSCRPAAAPGRGRTARPLVALLLAAGLLGLAGCRGAAPEPPASEPGRLVILLLLDAARADRFSSYGHARATTPEMDRLADDGVVFLHHYAQGTGTRESVPALLYSRYYSVPLFPNDPQVPYSNPRDLFRRPDDEQISLPRAFEAAGFHTAAISAHLWTGKDTPFAAEFQEMHDLTAGHPSGRYPYPRAREVIDFAVDWIGENRGRDVFLYLHLMDTHYPHYFEADAQAFFGAATYDARNFRDSGGPKVPAAQLTEDDRRYVDALYDGSLRYADREIGRLLEHLRADGRLENSVIAVTSDHGEHLLDPGHEDVTVFSHGGPWLEPVARIPLLVYAPGILGAGRYEGLSEGVDVAPTLLALAGVGLPAGRSFDGVDLAAVVAGGEPEEEALTRGGLRTSRYKALFATPDRALLGPEPPRARALKGRLYDLAEDPAETRNLFRTEPDAVAELVSRYRQVMKGPFERALAARTDAPPRSPFAISARYFVTDERLPRVRGNLVPQGWSLLAGEPHSALLARDAERPLAVRFRLPNGPYGLTVGLAGRATVEVGDERRQLAGQGMVAFGDVEVTGETFRATISPRPGELARIFFFGFVPPGAVTDDAEAREREERLRALGYL